MHLINYVTEGLQSGFKINLESEISQCESSKDKDFIKILFAKLGLNDTEGSVLASSKEDDTDETKSKLDPANYLASLATYNLLFPFQTISSLDTLDKMKKEEILKLLEGHNSPEEFSSIISKMKPGDEVIFRINDKEITIKRISQLQISISESREMREISGASIDRRDLSEIKEAPSVNREIAGASIDRRDLSEIKEAPSVNREIAGSIDRRDLSEIKETPGVNREIAGSIKEIREENPVTYEKQSNIIPNPIHSNKEEDIEVFKQKKDVELKIASDRSDTKEPLSRKVDKTARTLENDSDFNSMHLRANRDILTVDRSLREEGNDFSQKIVKLISERITGNNKTGEAILKLHPDSSGEVRVRIFLEDERLNIRLMVSNEKLRDLIESNIDSLKRSLFEKGLELGSVSVYIMGESEMSSSRRDRYNRFNFAYPYKEGNKKIDVVEVISMGSLIDLIV